VVIISELTLNAIYSTGMCQITDDNENRNDHDQLFHMILDMSILALHVCLERLMEKPPGGKKIISEPWYNFKRRVLFSWDELEKSRE
jgi:hypothetical protein